MKIVELRRHSKKIGPGNKPLSEEGVDIARRVGENELRGRRFTHLYVSELQRTRDTMRALADGAGDFPMNEPGVFLGHSDVFRTDDAMRLWEGVCREAERKGEDMVMASIERDPKRAEPIASLGAAVFRQWLDALPDGTNALVVHHSPSIELIVYGLFGVTLPQLQPCDGVRITSQDVLRLTTTVEDSSLNAGRFYEQDPPLIHNQSVDKT